MPKKLNADDLPGDKLLALYQRLTLEGRRHFQDEIARNLRCSSQSVTRLIAIIARNLGRNTEIQTGIDKRRRYYQVVSNNNDSSLGFCFEELHYLAVCRDIAAPGLPPGIASRIDQTLKTLALHFGESDNSSLTGAPIAFRSKGFIDYALHSATIATLREAIGKKRVCRVTYTAGGRAAPALYRYAPGRIIASGGTLYCTGFRLEEGSLLKDRPTVFSVHRISEVTPSGEYFRFDADYTDTGGFGFVWHEPKRISVRVDASAADYVRDRIWSADQTIEELDGGHIVLTVTTTSENELNSWVGSFRGLARVEAIPTVKNSG